ncbi:MAG: AAA family ATPase [Gemmataceae bacterium]|nr:AAA family ATPase [Gemmataceae bacterium]
MRIESIEVRNFKKFAQQAIEFHRQFTLLVGENGSGKTSILDALAVALGVWLVDVPDSDLANSRRSIDPAEIRLEPTKQGDRTLFREVTTGVIVKAVGQIQNSNVTWARQIGHGKRTTNNVEAKDALDVISDCYKRANAEEKIILPVIAYYGAGRAWLAHRDRSFKKKTKTNGPARRWAAFYDCLNERIRLTDLAEWFQSEAIAAVNRGGRFRPGFEVVRRAALRCIPGADGMWFDGDRKEIVLSISGHAQPFGNLSAGQRMMLALVADIAIKTVTQNNFLVPPDSLTTEDEPLPRVLKQTPGVVLIDELDVHLHPRWQRRVATDLKTTFPQIQFVCTTHSPQVIGEVKPDEIRLLDESHVGQEPAHSFGLDSNAILEELMDAESRTPEIRNLIEQIEQSLEEGDLEAARSGLQRLKELQYGDTRDTARIEATINNLEALSNAGD